MLYFTIQYNAMPCYTSRLKSKRRCMESQVNSYYHVLFKYVCSFLINWLFVFF